MPRTIGLLEQMKRIPWDYPVMLHICTYVFDHEKLRLNHWQTSRWLRTPLEEALPMAANLAGLVRWLHGYGAGGVVLLN